MPILPLAELRNSRKEQYPVDVTIEEFPPGPALLRPYDRRSSTGQNQCRNLTSRSA